MFSVCPLALFIMPAVHILIQAGRNMLIATCRIQLAAKGPVYRTFGMQILLPAAKPSPRQVLELWELLLFLWLLGGAGGGAVWWPTSGSLAFVFSHHKVSSGWDPGLFDQISSGWDLWLENQVSLWGGIHPWLALLFSVQSFTKKVGYYLSEDTLLVFFKIIPGARLSRTPSLLGPLMHLCDLEAGYRGDGLQSWWGSTGIWTRDLLHPSQES